MEIEEIIERYRTVPSALYYEENPGLERWEDILKADIQSLLNKQLDEPMEVLEAISSGVAFDKETGLIWKHWLDKIDNILAKKENK